MKGNESNRRLSISGEIVELFEEEGKNIAKIQLKPHFIEIHINHRKDYHLGDQVQLDIEITINEINQNFNNNTYIEELNN